MGWDSAVSSPRYQNRVVGEISDRQFSTEYTQYFKNPQMRNMDDHYGDIESVIQGELGTLIVTATYEPAARIS
jgi:hypothetical protein